LKGTIILLDLIFFFEQVSLFFRQTLFFNTKYEKQPSSSSLQLIEETIPNSPETPTMIIPETLIRVNSKKIAEELREILKDK